MCRLHWRRRMGVSVAIIKPADNGCNLQCRYCYVEGQTPKTKLMSVDTGKIIVDNLFNQQDVQYVEFLWHGGEPLLRGIPFYEEIFEYQKTVATSCNKKYVNAFQTNLTLLDNEWLDFFKKHNITISTSLDGSQRLHDINRVTSGGIGTFGIIKDKIELAQSRGFNVNVLCVVSKTNVDFPEEVCDSFNALGINHVGFLPCYKTDNRNIVYPSLSPGEYGSFMTRVFDLFLDKKLTFEVREFEQFFGGVIGHPQDICSFTGHCTHFICINSDGDVFSCDTSPQDDDHLFGNILKTSLQELLRSSKYTAFSCRTQQIPSSCKQCRFFTHCHNGCFNMRTNGTYRFCEDRKALYTYFEHLIRKINAEREYLYDVN